MHNTFAKVENWSEFELKPLICHVSVLCVCVGGGMGSLGLGGVGVD